MTSVCPWTRQLIYEIVFWELAADIEGEVDLEEIRVVIRQEEDGEEN